MERGRFIDRFSLDTSLGELDCATGISFSSRLQIFEELQRGISVEEAIRLLLLANTQLNGTDLTRGEADKLTDDDLERFSARVIEERAKRDHSIKEGAGETSRAALAKYIENKSNRGWEDISKVAAANAFAGNRFAEVFSSFTAAKRLSQFMPQLHEVPDNQLASHARFATATAASSIPPLRPVQASSLSLGQEAIDKVMSLVEERRKTLPSGRLVGLVCVSAPGDPQFQVADMKADGVYIILAGFAPNEGDASQIVQHYTQLNIKITEVSETYKIGFLTE